MLFLLIVQKELEALSRPSNSTTKAAKPANFSMIRTGPEDLGDFNVENMVLTPEDENNPELLAELSALTIEVKPKEESETYVDSVKELKKEILELKRRGDLEGAKAKLKELNEIEKDKGDYMESERVTKTANTVITADYKSDTVTVSSVPTSPKIVSKDAQVYRDLFAKLQKQSATCQTVSEFYAAANRKSDANLFIKRKQALDLETQKLRLMLKNKQPVPPSKNVNVTYEYVLSNPEVPEGQLQVSFGLLKVILPRKFKLKDTEEYKLNVSYELFGLTEQEFNLISEPFTTQGLTNSKHRVNFGH